MKTNLDVPIWRFPHRCKILISNTIFRATQKMIKGVYLIMYIFKSLNFIYFYHFTVDYNTNNFALQFCTFVVYIIGCIRIFCVLFYKFLETMYFFDLKNRRITLGNKNNVSMDEWQAEQMRALCTAFGFRSRKYFGCNYPKPPKCSYFDLNFSRSVSNWFPQTWVRCTKNY